MIAATVFVIAPKCRGLLLWFALIIILVPILFGFGAYGLGLVLLSPYLFALLAAPAIVIGVGILFGLLARYCCKKRPPRP
jgi:hypothetical protein